MTEKHTPKFPVRGLHRHELNSSDQYLVYILDCTLATVCDLAGKKSRSTSEYERQISIAQIGIDWCKTMDEVHGGRVADILKANITVKEWALKYEVAKVTKK